VVERDERRAVLARQPPKHSVARRTQMVQAFARHAIAHVKDEHDVEGHLLEAHEVDILPDAVVEHLEVSRPESGHRLSVLGHERVDAHRFHPRRERRPLAALGRP